MTGFSLDSQNNIYMLGFNGTIYKLDHKDLTPATSIRRPIRRLEVSSGGVNGLRVPREGPTALYGIDGARLGTLSSDGRYQGRTPARNAGILIAVPSGSEAGTEIRTGVRKP
jgi:hypothetical protein